MRKRIFLISGFKSHIASRQYEWLVSYLSGKSYDVIPVPIKWNYRTFTQNAKEFVEFYKRNKTSNDYVLGFSFGAVIAILTAEIVSPKSFFYVHSVLLLKKMLNICRSVFVSIQENIAMLILIRGVQ